MTASQILTEFRSDSDKVKALRETLELPIMQEAILALKASGPENYSVLSSAAEHVAHIHHGQVMGYVLALNRLSDLATHIQSKPRVDEDYAEGN